MYEWNRNGRSFNWKGSHYVCEIASIARAFLHHSLEAYPVDSIALRVSNWICIFYSVLTFDDEFGGGFYGASRRGSSAGEGACVLFVGRGNEEHSIVAFVDHLEFRFSRFRFHSIPQYFHSLLVEGVIRNCKIDDWFQVDIITFSLDLSVVSHCNSPGSQATEGSGHLRDTIGSLASVSLEKPWF